MESCTESRISKSPSLIPQPLSVELQFGSFILSAKTQLTEDDSTAFSAERTYLISAIKESTGISLSNAETDNKIVLRKSDACSIPESYCITINSKEIVLSAADKAGMFYAIETLRQLIFNAGSNNKKLNTVSLPNLNIKDHPKYSWRGMHLDVSRHFFSVDFLKKYVDILALYKINKLHLHLTDDQGWRLEIKKYPLLTEKGAWRTFNDQDSVCMQMAEDDPLFALDTAHIIRREGKDLYGGFYTQKQMKDFVKYAAKRHVEVIPEIDMPGHMMAAINIYPELSATGESSWGKVFSTPLNPVEDKVYSFVQDVLDEVIDVFSSDYIHIGADEVEKSSWKNSKECQLFMKKNGFEDEEQLHGYFVNRIADYLKEKGKKVIVWDDALDGGIDSTLNVMYWRNWVGGVPERVASNGNHMIMVPGDPLYFSRMTTPLYNIYNMKLPGDKYPADKKNLIKGIQACVWSEKVGSSKVVEAIVFPKLLALSERAWSSDDVLNWESFKTKVKDQLPLLDSLGVNYYYKPTKELIPVMNVDTVQKRIGISFISEISKPTIFYTTDGTVPTIQSASYDGQFFVKDSAVICAAVFSGDSLQEPMLKKTVDYHLAIGKKVIYNKPWNKAYPAGDAGSLTDGYRGGNSYGDGKWQGFTNDLDVVIDLGQKMVFNKLSATFMQNAGPGVFMPDFLEVSVSDDGKNFENIGRCDNDVSVEETELTLKTFSCALKNTKARYVKVVAKNGRHAFIFTDEIVLN